MKKILLTFICSLSFSLFSDVDPTNYVNQVVNDCNALLSSLNTLSSDIGTLGTYINDASFYYQVLTSDSGQEKEDILYRLAIAQGSASALQSYIDPLSQYITSVRNTAQQLSLYSSAGSVDLTVVTNIYSYLNLYQRQELTNICNSIHTSLTLLSAIASELQGDSSIGKLSLDDHLNEQRDFLLAFTADFADIEGYLNSLNHLVDSVDTNVISILSSLSDIKRYIQNYLIPYVTNMGNTWTNSFWDVSGFVLPLTGSFVQLTQYPQLKMDGSFYPYSISYRNIQNLTDLLTWFYRNFSPSLASLNNYAFTNMVTLTSIARNTDKTNDLSSIVSSIDQASASITNTINARFTIFDVSSPFQSYYNLNNNPTNAYYNFLTNYYLNVSLGNASGSASESHTNWFSRIEMLLGALVFKDASDGSFSPGNTNMDSVENAYDAFTQSLETAVEIPSTFQSKIEDAEQSILDYMQKWHSIISSATLGSHFTLCDVQLTEDDGSSSRRDGSTPSFDGRMNLSIPIEGNFKNFLDVARALSTVCFITLFLIMSLKLIIFLLRACASITRVCYALFMAIAGH